jgi:hypothetical protein
MILRILVKVYKENATLWYASDNGGSPSAPIIGVTRNISCNHTYLGMWGINMQAEEVPVPTSTIPPEIGSGQSNQSAQSIIPIGNVYVDLNYFGDANFKVCVKVKDMVTNIVSFVDAADYAAQIGKCNLVEYANFCPLVTGLGATPGGTTATINWTAPGGSAGVEYVNNTSSTAPAGTGTFLATGTNSVALSALSHTTTYYFWIRTICAGGVLSAWTSVTYTTS